MPRVYVVKTTDKYSGEPIPGVFEELQNGRARIGWSYRDDLDLRLIEEKSRKGSPLDEDEQDAKRCLGFLTRPAWNDYLVYPHQPKRRQFCIVQVKGKYEYLSEDDSLNGDFRSFRCCSLITPESVDMYDEIVPSQLRQRLGKPGRFSKVYDTGPLSIVLDSLHKAGTLQDGSNRVAMERIYDELRKKLPDVISREFGGAELSRKFCRQLFERMGYSIDRIIVQEGPTEFGSDVVVTVGDPLLPEEFRIGIQVFSYKKTVQESDLKSKLEQLLKGWSQNSLDYGVLLTTGRCSEEARKLLLRHNDQNKPKQLVRLIDGDEFADIFLQYFPPGYG